MGFLAALPAIASVASGLFGKKKKSGGDTTSAQTLLPDYQMSVGQDLSEYIQKYLSQYQPGKAYSGSFVAPTSEAEDTGLNRLTQFLASPELSNLFGATEQNLLETVQGKYANPATSPFIQAMTDLSNRNLQGSIDTARRSAGARGSYFTKSAIDSENDLREGAQLGLNTVIGDFANQERGRQLQASPLALALEKYKMQDVPLARVAASQQYGALPRLLEQADLEMQYQDFERKQKELGAVPGQAQALFGNNTPFVPSYTNPVVQENNALGNILSMISKLNLGALSGGGNIWDKIGGVFAG